MDYRNSLPPGYRLEHYRIESVLGRGGFGITYAATELTAGVQVAIKELLPDTIATRVDDNVVAPHSSSHNNDWQWARERFLEEARLLSSLRHRAIVRIHEVIDANGTNYMVMEYIEGESYEARLKKIGWESSQHSLSKVVCPIMDGLSAVHAAGFLHKDIKPDNILISDDGQPVLIDFGSARQALSQTVTMTSIVTHGYSPIEQYQSRGKTGAWTDIYALGAVMYRAITGEKVPRAPDRLADDSFEWLRFRNPGGYSAQFLSAVDWCLQLNAGDRPQLLGQLRPYFEGDAEFVPLSTRTLPRDSYEIANVDETVHSSADQPALHRKTSTITLAVIFGIAAYFVASLFSQFFDLERTAVTHTGSNGPFVQGERATPEADSADQGANSRKMNEPDRSTLMPSSPQEAYAMYEVQRMRMLANQAKAAGYTTLQTDPAEDPESWREALENGIEVQVGGGQTAVFKMEGPPIIRTK